MFLIMDSSFVGFLYFFLSSFSGLLGFGFSFMMSLELMLPYSMFGDGMFYVCVTSHAVLMVFFFLTVLATGFSNFFLPGMLGSSDFFFPSVNFFSFLLLFSSFVFLLFSLFFGEGVSTGWTLYPPLSSKTYSFSYSVDFFILSVHLFTFSSTLSSINTICTVFYFKNLGVSWLDLNVFMWSSVVTSFLNILSLPYFTSALTFLFLDSNFNCVFFDPSFGGDPLLFQSLFWFWGHPEVYILMIPVFGVVSLVVSSIMSKEFMFGHSCVIVSMISVGVLGFLVWGHHMVSVGWSVDVKSFFMAATVVISLPTGLKVFNWACSMYFFNSKNNSYDLSFYFIFIFIFYFVFGGVTGVMLSNFSIDIILHDTYFVVGHFHYILSLAAFFGYLCGLFYIWPSLSCGFKMDFFGGVFFIFFFFFSSNLVFLPFHFLGLSGCPSSMSCYSDGYFSWFYFSSVGFLGLLFSIFFLILIIFFSVNSSSSLFFLDFFNSSGSLSCSFLVMEVFVFLFFTISFFYYLVFCFFMSGRSTNVKDYSYSKPCFFEITESIEHSSEGAWVPESNNSLVVTVYFMYDFFSQWLYALKSCCDSLLGHLAKQKISTLSKKSEKEIYILEGENFFFLLSLFLFSFFFLVFYFPFGYFDKNSIFEGFIFTLKLSEDSLLWVEDSFGVLSFSLGSSYLDFFNFMFKFFFFSFYAYAFGISGNVSKVKMGFCIFLFFIMLFFFLFFSNYMKMIDFFLFFFFIPFCLMLSVANEVFPDVGSSFILSFLSYMKGLGVFIMVVSIISFGFLNTLFFLFSFLSCSYVSILLMLCINFFIIFVLGFSSNSSFRWISDLYLGKMRSEARPLLVGIKSASSMKKYLSLGGENGAFYSFLEVFFSSYLNSVKKSVFTNGSYGDMSFSEFKFFFMKIIQFFSFMFILCLVLSLSVNFPGMFFYLYFSFLGYFTCLYCMTTVDEDTPVFESGLIPLSDSGVMPKSENMDLNNLSMLDSISYNFNWVWGVYWYHLVCYIVFSVACLCTDVVTIEHYPQSMVDIILFCFYFFSFFPFCLLFVLFFCSLYDFVYGNERSHEDSFISTFSFFFSELFNFSNVICISLSLEKCVLSVPMMSVLYLYLKTFYILCHMSLVFLFSMMVYSVNHCSLSDDYNTNGGMLDNLDSYLKKAEKKPATSTEKEGSMGSSMVYSFFVIFWVILGMSWMCFIISNIGPFDCFSVSFSVSSFLFFSFFFFSWFSSFNLKDLSEVSVLLSKISSHILLSFLGTISDVMHFFLVLLSYSFFMMEQKVFDFFNSSGSILMAPILSFLFYFCFYVVFVFFWFLDTLFLFFCSGFSSLLELGFSMVKVMVCLLMVIFIYSFFFSILLFFLLGFLFFLVKCYSKEGKDNSDF